MGRRSLGLSDEQRREKSRLYMQRRRAQGLDNWTAGRKKDASRKAVAGYAVRGTRKGERREPEERQLPMARPEGWRDPRSLIGQAMGDPMPGRSALDEERRA